MQTLLHRLLYVFLVLIFLILILNYFPILTPRDARSLRFLYSHWWTDLTTPPPVYFTPLKESLLLWSSQLGLLQGSFPRSRKSRFLLTFYFITLTVKCERVGLYSDRRGRRGAEGQTVVSGCAAVKLAPSLGVFREDKHGKMAIIYGMCQLP